MTSSPPRPRSPDDRQSTAPDGATPAHRPWKERRRLNAEKNGTTISAADDASPVTMAKVGGAELLRSLRDNARERDELRADLRARAERAEHQADAYRAELDRLRATDPEPAEPPAKPARRGTRGQAAQPRQAADQ